MEMLAERLTQDKVILKISGSRDSFTNNRSVSLQAKFSKIFEDLFKGRLDRFLEMNHTLSNSNCKNFANSQYGFRNNSTTCHALIDLYKLLTKSIDWCFI